MYETRIQAEDNLRPWLLKICEDIEKQLQRKIHEGDAAPLLVAIDGQCASGKTTLGEMLARRFDCNLFHMDDFFLRPEQRTKNALRKWAGMWIMSGFGRRCSARFCKDGHLLTSLMTAGTKSWPGLLRFL